ncbi:MAG: FecR domain-containing protein [Planctomycetes bacterium]|nr:FecR domain-containing protein [Planctomycetota bacterium]
MNDKNDWEELVDRHLRGELDGSEKEHLAELLDSNASARREFVEHVQWDTEFAEALHESGYSPRDADIVAAERAKTDGQWASKPTFLRLMLAAAAVVIVVLSAGLIYQRAYPQGGIHETNVIAAQRRVSDVSIARITGLSGSLIWTGDRGQIARDVRVGTELPGGTIEGMAPDSWFELQFNDGSTVMIAGTSMLTFADPGQKELRLREGIFSAKVVPQPKGKPMLIHTPSTLLEVLGTQFDVEASLDSTMLNVTEGKVRVRRLSDGREVDVPAKHRVIAEGGGDLTPQPVPESVNHWKSQLHLRPGCYGTWLPATELRAAAQKSIPLVPRENPSVTLYLLGIPVSRSNGPPVVVRSNSQFVVRGRLNKPAKVHFGIAVSDVNGEFAGKFRGDLDHQQPISEPDEDGQFEVVYRIGDFTLDPCVHDRKEELAGEPDGLVLNGVWAFTNLGGPSGLEVTEIELVPPRQGRPTPQMQE